MRVKKIGDIPNPPKTEILNNVKINSSDNFNITKEDVKDETTLTKNKPSSYKIYYIIGGCVVFLAAFFLIYLFVIENDDSENDSGVTQIPPSEVKDLALKQKDLELRERELNSKKGKIEKDKQNRMSNVNYDIFEGYYQVGNTFCNISSTKGIWSAKWDKGSGWTKIIDDVQGDEVLYIEYDFNNKECGYFYFYDDFHVGDYTRKDGKVFKVTKIR